MYYIEYKDWTVSFLDKETLTEAFAMPNFLKTATKFTFLVSKL